MILKRGGFLKRTPLKKRGSLSLKWQDFANQKAERDKDEDGLLHCQCRQLGLRHCGIARERSQMDLHHIIERNVRPDLYFAESNLVWLTRACHRLAHDRVQYEDNPYWEGRQ